MAERKIMKSEIGIRKTVLRKTVIRKNAIRGKHKGATWLWGVFGLLLLMEPMQAEAEESNYPIQYGEKPDTGMPVMELTEGSGEYMVLPGDCLWDIAEKLWGDGNRYVELADVNRETVKNPDVIYPGMALQTERTGYIIREEATRGGIQMGEYSMDVPYGWTVGYLDSGEAFANFALSGEGKIACLVRDKEQGTVSETEDWEACIRQIRQYAEQNYKDSVQDLAFEHYQMDGGEDVYLYSYTYQVDLEDYGWEGSFGWDICMGMKLTSHIQAEFVGTSNRDYDIRGSVRYVAASFEEHCEEGKEDTFSVNDSNMAISPAVGWDMDGMFNPFPWVEEYFSALLERVTGVSRENISKKEALLEQFSRPAK